LDRRRPLWRSCVIEGLAQNRFAVLTIAHHAAFDFASGVELFTYGYGTWCAGDIGAGAPVWAPRADA